MKPQVAFFGNRQKAIDNVYPESVKENLARIADIFPEHITDDNFALLLPRLEKVVAIFSTWGMLNLTCEQVKRMPNLKLLFYGAGSVKKFARPFLENGIRLIGGWHANGESVAELTVGQILLSCKGYFRNCLEYKDSNFQDAQKLIGEGNFRSKVAILGAGAVGRRIIKILRDSFHHEILLYDPYVKDEEAASLGSKKAGLEECFKQALVISNHMPALPETEKIITRKHFLSMREGATFINTARGTSVDQNGMIKALTKRTDLTALLDVTTPEPLPEDHILFSMSNVRISTHVAGALEQEQQRMGLFLVETFEQWLNDGSLNCEISIEMLDKMA